MRRTKIVCTIGPASRAPDVLRAVIVAGMDVARLNFSHGDQAEHAENIARIRSVSGKLGVPVAILADLQGPKLRVGTMAEAGVDLKPGSEAVLVTADIVGCEPGALPIQYQGFPHLVEVGDRVLLDDGLLELRVLSKSSVAVHCRVITGGKLRSNKGVNLPGAVLDLPPITDKDRSDLRFALAHGVDWLALSFVRSAADVRALTDIVREQSAGQPPVPVIAKIEKPAALEHLDEIVQCADGIMVARGDLGIELSPEQVPMAQKEMVRACNQAGVPVITATQMLDSMIRNPRPTRAEASDVANAILDGTDAVMLSGETSIGAYPVGAVQTMAGIASEIELHLEEGWVCPHPATQGTRVQSTAEAVSLAARETAHALGAAAIITPTVSGYTARVMAHHRPRAPIVAVTPSEHVQRQLALYWGVVALLAPRTDNTDTMIEQAVRAARERGLVDAGDTVVVTAGAAGSAPGTTNLIRVLTVGQ